jgi:hypothetical protein|tara:strand:- start:6753 stop:7562 length:810 start_codon:yes stop_codon:yes gene_type:complete
VQRRRRKKAAPKNVFGSSSQSPQKSQLNKSARTKAPRSRTQIAPPPSVPGAKPKPKVNPVETPIEVVVEPIVEPIVEPPSITIEDDTTEVEKHEEDVLEGQLLGRKKRKDIVLNETTKQVAPKQPPVDSGKSLKARQIIQDSMLKASLAAKAAKIQKATEAKPAVTKEAPKKPQRKFRRKTSYQPANRARRLDRSRHMEYKYEMRGLLVDIGIAEEYRSNLLAIIWARGERQTTKEAKEFLDEKLSEGIIDEKQMSSLERVVEAYTVRR